MTALITWRDTPQEKPTIARYDLVRVPEGRIGSVLGFYRREHAESVLVWFSANECAEFLTTEVELV
jgi:hypothetical protein